MHADTGAVTSRQGAAAARSISGTHIQVLFNSPPLRPMLQLKRYPLFALIALAVSSATCLALLCAHQAYSLLSAQAQVDATALAQSYALVLGERLTAAEKELELAAGRLEEGDGMGDGVGALARPYFDSLLWIDGEGSNRQLFGDADALKRVVALAAQQALGEKTILFAQSEGSSMSTITLVRRISASRSGALVGLIDPQYLWQTADAARLGSRALCVSVNGTPTSSCHREVVEFLSEQPIASSSAMAGSLTWGEDSGNQIGGYAKVGLPETFDPVRLDVVVAHTNSTLQQIARMFALQLVPWFAVAFVVLVMVFKVLLRSGGSRNDSHGSSALVPSIAAPGKSERPPVMHASAPPSQPAIDAAVMSVFADIDRAILARAPLERVLDLILSGMPSAMGFHCAGVTLLDRESSSKAKVFVPSQRSDKYREVDACAVDAATLDRLSKSPDGYFVESVATAPFLRQLAQRGAAGALLVPVFVDAQLAGILCGGVAQNAAPPRSQQALVRDCANRLGVAIMAAVRAQDLYQETFFDHTTSLPNQRLLRERLGQEIARAQRDNHQFAVMYVDLDQFHKVNDSLGHELGDTVLEQASRRMRNCLRQDDVITRFSGDEFVILLLSLGRLGNVTRVAEKLIDVLSEPFTISNEVHYIGASVGISFFPQDGRTVDKLLRNANFAMYRAKSAGRGQSTLFDEKMNRMESDRRILERELRVAVSNGDLSIAYQPQIDLRTGKISGAEALVRWKHAERGFIPPGVFIEIAEQSTLIEGVGEFVRETACAQHHAWHASGMNLSRIAVNVSSREVRRSRFAEQIEALVRRWKVRPFLLELEVTESLFLDHSDQVLQTLHSLHELGVHLAIDDFGTGYSSLAYLKTLPVNGLKVDRSFIKDLGTGDGSEGVVDAIFGVARSLGKYVIAEGVETQAQLAFLMNRGCDGAQGYLWSQPISAQGFEKLYRNWVEVPRFRASESAVLQSENETQTRDLRLELS
jgi:diguanylate cyclase (GGDEF)-like protein